MTYLTTARCSIVSFHRADIITKKNVHTSTKMTTTAGPAFYHSHIHVIYGQADG